MIILNVTQNKGFNSSLQNTVLGKPQGGESTWQPQTF